MSAVGGNVATMKTQGLANYPEGSSQFNVPVAAASKGTAFVWGTNPVAAGGAGGRVLVDNIVVTERAGSQQSLTIRLVKGSAGVAGTEATNGSMDLFSGITITANQVMVLNGPFYLTDADFLSAFAGNANALNLMVNFRKEV